MDNIAYLHSLGLTGPDVTLAHCVWLSAEERALLAGTSTHVCHCPSANLKLASGTALVPELLAEGINLCLGADGAACNNNLDMFQEMRLAALIHAPRVGAGALPPERVLEMATLGGARALGLEAEIGSVEQEKRADLTILDLSASHAIPAANIFSQIVYSARASDVVHVLVDGQILMQDRELLTLDERLVVSSALKQARMLHARAQLLNFPWAEQQSIAQDAVGKSIE
jgi:cytosine/adenosine deaminase-related metal-dependent hydrolase